MTASDGREFNFDGLVGPTHQYGGLSAGNLASVGHRGERGNPKEAALEGIAKMRRLLSLGVGQAVLPPQARPVVSTLRRLGFVGRDSEVLATALRQAPELLVSCSSASSMWAANAATVAPSSDTEDGRVHISVANLSSMFHRSLEAAQTHRTLSAIFSDRKAFRVHRPLPGGGLLADEGAANHLRLQPREGVALHLFAWGRRAPDEPLEASSRHPIRQAFEASLAVARLNRLDPAMTLFLQQSAAGIAAGAFHTDVLAVSNEHFLLMHEQAWVTGEGLQRLQELGEQGALTLRRVPESELGLGLAVERYPFNSQLVTLPNGRMAVVAPEDCRANHHTARFFESLLAEDNPIERVEYVDVNSSMKNGGGPACLRLRVRLRPREVEAVRARVFVDEARLTQLEAWVKRHYRDRLSLQDLADVALLREVEAALDELTQLLELGSIYPFQRVGPGGV